MRSPTHSELIHPARKIEFESCKKLKKKQNGQILNFRRKNGGIIRSKGIFFETFWANSSGGFEGSQTFKKKKKLSSRFISIFLHFLFHLLSSFSYFIFSCLSSLLFHLFVSSLFLSRLPFFIFSCLLVSFRLLSSLFFCLSFSVFLSLSPFSVAFLCLLSLSLSVPVCPCLSLSPCVVVVVVVVSCVCVVVVVVCAYGVVWHAEHPRVYILKVPVCTGNRPADVLNVHTEGVLNVHTGRGVGVWGGRSA